MTDYQAAFAAIVNDTRYQQDLDWGEPRRGHPEGTVRAHVAELERNLEALRPRLSEADYWKLKLLVHTHDTFKAETARGVPIADPRSHASLARDFLAGHCPDPDLLAMVQYHDEPFALWRQQRANGAYDPDRFAALLGSIRDWDLFLAFLLIDGCTWGKTREPLLWFFAEVAGKTDLTFSVADIMHPNAGYSPESQAGIVS